MASAHASVYVEAVGFLRGYKIGAAASKEHATHQMELEGYEGRCFYEVTTAEGRQALKTHIIRCWTAGDPLPLSEIAPPVARLFLDLDTNKKSDDEEVTETDIFDFVQGLQRFLGYLVDSGVAMCVIDGARKTAEQASGFEFVPEEGLVDNAGEQVELDGCVAYVLSSNLGKVSQKSGKRLMSYHVVFPLLFCERKDVHTLLKAVMSKGDHTLSTKFKRAVAGCDKVLRHADIDVLRNGFLRGVFCDKLGAKRPYEPFAIVNRERVYRAGETKLLDDFSLVYNAASIVYVPDSVREGFVNRTSRRSEARVSRAHSRLDGDLPRAETLDPTAWRERFRNSRRRYDPFALIALVQKVYEQLAADQENTKQTVIDGVKSAVIYEMNHHVAFLRGRHKASFVTKWWHSSDDTLEFHLRDTGDVSQMFISSGTSVLWPPEGRHLGANGEPRKQIKIKPFKIWLASPLRTEFTTLVVKPPGAIPPAEPEELNIWAPVALSRADVAGKMSHSISLPLAGEWSTSCREWLEERERRAAIGAGMIKGYVPPSAADDKFARAVFAADEIYQDERGELRRRFDVYTFTRHIHDVLCNGNDQLFRFVLSWLASIVQYPGKKLRSCLIFVGEEGCGKNFVIDSLGAILGAEHYMATANHADLDRFNSALCGKTLLVLNECSRFSAAEEGVLRALITEGKLRVEQKFKEPLFVDNLVNVICITNITTHNLFSNVSANARRWCIARCSEAPTVSRDPLYWKGLWAWLGVADGQVGMFGRPDGIRAFADLLYNYKIPDDWNSGAPPTTEELVLHKLGGMNEVAHWWHECLISGRLYPAGCSGDSSLPDLGVHRTAPPGGTDFSAWVKGPVEIDLELLYQESFIRSFHGKRASVVSSSTLPWFKKQLEELGAFYTTRPRDLGTRRRRTMLFPLKICRQHFCAKYRADDMDAIFGDGVDAETTNCLDFRPPSPQDSFGRLDPNRDSRDAWMSSIPAPGPAPPPLPATASTTGESERSSERDEGEGPVVSVLGPLLEKANEIEKQLASSAENRRRAATAAAGIPQDIAFPVEKHRTLPPDVSKFIDDAAEEGSAGEEEGDEEEEEEDAGEPVAKRRKEEPAASAEAGIIWQKRQEEEERRRRDEARRVALEDFVRKSTRVDPFVDEAAAAALAAAKAPAPAPAPH